MSDADVLSRPKSSRGRVFEDFSLGEVIEHASPRTIGDGEVSIYHALTGNRFTLQVSDPFARDVGYHAAPVDDLLVFNMVFGQSVPDISSNAVANLGYAEVDFLSQLYVGETVRARSEVIGLKENSSGETGVVYVRTEGLDHRGTPVLRFVRWVMVPTRAGAAAKGAAGAVAESVPPLAAQVAPLTIPRHRLNKFWSDRDTGSPHRWEDYEAGEKIDHLSGVTVEEAEHMMATRLYLNNSHTHFDGHAMKSTPFGRRVVYGGHVISIARALTHNGLANACIVSAIHGGRHANPTFAGDTLYAWTEVLEKQELDRRQDIGALRLRTTATKNLPCAGFPRLPETKGAKKTAESEAIVLELDYTVILPRR